MTVAHSEALTVLANWSIAVIAIAAVIGVVAFCTRSREPRADDAKNGSER